MTAHNNNSETQKNAPPKRGKLKDHCHDELHKRATARKAEIVIPKRSRGRQSVTAQLAYQESPPLGGAMTAATNVITTAASIAVVSAPAQPAQGGLRKPAGA